MQRRLKYKLLKILPTYGCMATGVLYGSIGIIAILSLLQFRDGGADERSVMAIFNSSIIGKIIIWIILSGTVCYIISRIWESVIDAYGYGRHPRGIVKRIVVGLSTSADILIVNSAIRVLLAMGHAQVNGQPVEERALMKQVLSHSWGATAIMIGGILVSITAVVQFYNGITKGYRERTTIDITRSKNIRARLFNAFAIAGYSARLMILGTIGFFQIKAAAFHNSKYVINTDKAFDFIGDNIGHTAFIAVAIGTICYGVFMIILGVTYKVNH